MPLGHNSLNLIIPRLPSIADSVGMIRRPSSMERPASLEARDKHYDEPMTAMYLGFLSESSLQFHRMPVMFDTFRASSWLRTTNYTAFRIQNWKSYGPSAPAILFRWNTSGMPQNTSSETCRPAASLTAPTSRAINTMTSRFSSSLL